MDRVFRWMDKNDVDMAGSRVLDLGCGNGVDYSHDAVKLAQQIAEARDVNNVTFKHCD